MHSSLLSSFIFICKLMICISILISVNTRRWIRNIEGDDYQGPIIICYNYGHSCYGDNHVQHGILFYCIVVSLNFVLELLNILLLCKRSRSRINLIIEALAISTILVFLIAGILTSLNVHNRIIHDADHEFDWSFILFLLSLVLALIDLICSLVRVVSYSGDHSSRSNVITYTSKNNHETVHIQS